jgi:hypothetical protein
MYNPIPMCSLRVAMGLFVGMFAALPGVAQVETELRARARLFPEVGRGARALQRDSAGRFYVLTAPGAMVQVFDAAGKRVAQMPASAGKETPLVYGDDLAVDSSGRVCVADRGADIVRVFNPDGSLALSIPVLAPTSVATLPEGEIAVASMKSAKLVIVFDARGKVVREFGEPTEIAERHDLNRFLNMGRLASDPASHIYYAFSYLPEPTVREYDRYGYAVQEIEVTALEFQPAAQAARREIERQERGGAPVFKPIITAITVDPANREIWVALGGLLLHFDRDGIRRGIYRTFTAEGVRLEAKAILIERDRLLLVGDPLGIYEFARPDRSDAIQPD